MDSKTIQELESVITDQDAVEQLQYIKNNVQQSSTVDEGLVGWCRETNEMKEQKGNTLKKLLKLELIEQGTSSNVDTGTKEIKARITPLGVQVLEFAEKFKATTQQPQKKEAGETNKVTKKIEIPPLKREKPIHKTR